MMQKISRRSPKRPAIGAENTRRKLEEDQYEAFKAEFLEKLKNDNAFKTELLGNHPGQSEQQLLQLFVRNEMAKEENKTALLEELTWRTDAHEIEKRLFPFPARDDPRVGEQCNATFTFKLFVGEPLQELEEAEELKKRLQSVSSSSTVKEMLNSTLKWAITRTTRFAARFKTFGEVHAALQVGRNTLHYLDHSLVEIKSWKSTHGCIFVTGVNDSGQLDNTMENRKKIINKVLEWNMEKTRYNVLTHNCQSFVESVCTALLGRTLPESPYVTGYLKYIRGLSVRSELKRCLVEANGSIKKYGGSLCEWDTHSEMDKWAKENPAAMRDPAIAAMIKAFCRGWQTLGLPRWHKKPNEKAISSSCQNSNITFTCCRLPDDVKQADSMKKYYEGEKICYSLNELSSFEGRQTFKAGGVRVLSLDGGGMRGVMALQLLAEMEQTTKKQVWQMFDLVVGVSTGAIIALCLTHMRMPAGQVLALYRLVGGEVFGDSYSKKAVQFVTRGALCRAIKEAVGGLVDDMPLMSQTYPKTAVLACTTANGPVLMCNYATERRDCKKTFRSGLKPEWIDSCSVLDAASASAAVPKLLEDVVIGGVLYRDGGIVANNPAMLAMDEAEALFPGRQVELLVSLGTGSFKEIPSNQQTLLELAKQIVIAATQSESVHVQLQALYKDQPGVYYRFQVPLHTAVAIDEVRPQVLEEVVEKALAYIQTNDSWLDLTRKLQVD